MPEITPPTPNPTPTPHRSRPGRIAALVVGSLVGLLALGLFAAGGVGLWADGQKDADGYLSTGSHRLAASSYAIASDDLDVDLDGAGKVLHRDRYGDVRLAATSRNGKDVFVGIARTRDVGGLPGPQRARHGDRRLHLAVPRDLPGPRRRPAAGRAGVRALLGRLAHGAGTQAVKWEVRDGRWSVVVMNADGTRGRRRRGQRRREPPVPARRGLGLDRRGRAAAPRRRRPGGRRRPRARAPARGGPRRAADARARRHQGARAVATEPRRGRPRRGRPRRRHSASVNHRTAIGSSSVSRQSGSPEQEGHRLAVVAPAPRTPSGGTPRRSPRCRGRRPRARRSAPAGRSRRAAR